MIFFRFLAAAHISRVNCTEMAGDGPRQPAYDIFDFLGSWSPSCRSLKMGCPFKMHYYLIARCIDSADGSMDAVAHHVSYAPITC